jgi:hypothetical protein
MVFTVIGVGFKSKLLVYEGTVNAETYRRNIETLAFLDELDQLHGRSSGSSNKREHRLTLPEVPSHGLDTIALCWLDSHQTRLISPIELCWAIFKKAVTFLVPTTREQLKEIVTHAWEQIPSID